MKKNIKQVIKTNKDIENQINSLLAKCDKYGIYVLDEEFQTSENKYDIVINRINTGDSNK